MFIGFINYFFGGILRVFMVFKILYLRGFKDLLVLFVY